MKSSAESSGRKTEVVSKPTGKVAAGKSTPAMPPKPVTMAEKATAKRGAASAGPNNERKTSSKVQIKPQETDVSVIETITPPVATKKATPTKATPTKAAGPKAPAATAGMHDEPADKPVPAKKAGNAGSSKPDVNKPDVNKPVAAKEAIARPAAKAAPAIAAQPKSIPKPAGKSAAEETEAAPETTQAESANVVSVTVDQPAPPVVPVPEIVTPVAAAAPVTHTHTSSHGGSHGGQRPGGMSMQDSRKPILPPRPMAKQETFVEGDHVVYPTHGVGKVERIVEEDIAGHRLELIHITFEENRMTLRVPVAKARTAGLRKLATRKLFDEAMVVLKGRARIKRTMWSRRAQEYEAKINSGDPLAIAEVVRDLHRNAGQPDQSFSERQIYEAAMDRLAAELAALDQTDKPAAAIKLVEFLKTI